MQRTGRQVGCPSGGNKGLKKTYTLIVEGKNRDRLLDASKHDIRKYVKRERAKPLPDGVDFWDFDCQLGASGTQVVAVHFAALMAGIDSLVREGAGQFCVEVVTKPGHRMTRPHSESSAATVEQSPGE